MSLPEQAKVFKASGWDTFLALVTIPHKEKVFLSTNGGVKFYEGVYLGKVSGDGVKLGFLDIAGRPFTTTAKVTDKQVVLALLTRHTHGIHLKPHVMRLVSYPPFTTYDVIELNDSHRKLIVESAP